MEMLDVVCIGILVADAIAKPVDGLPERGKLELVERMELYTGGCAANTAIDMARLGNRTGIIGKIGDDGFGRFIYSTLEKEKVDARGLVVDPGVSTSASVVLVDSGGERSFLHCLGANAQFDADDVSEQIMHEANMVFIGGSLLMPAFDGEPCAGILKKARKMGRFTALDTAWDSKGRWMNVIRPCMEHLDLFMPSYEEAVNLSGKTDPEDIADTFIGMGVRTAVIKLGKDGCFIKDCSGEKYRIPTYTDIKPVDTTGAGDAFVAGFLTGVTKGMGLYECGRLANAAGTHCVMAAGASTGIRSFEETQEFMRKYE